MRIEAHQVFNVSVQLCEFFNVDLSDRGYYQVRLKPKKSAEIAAVDISHEADGEREFPSEVKKANNILLAHVYQGTAVSKTVEVTYQHESFKIEDWFHISVQFNPTLNLCESQKLEIEVELFYMDRYHPPQYESFEKVTKRVVEIPLDPTRLVAAARCLYFDTSYLSAVTMSVFSSLVMVATCRRRNTPETASSQKSTKLRRVYNSSAHALLFATRSIQQFIVKNTSLLGSPVSVEILDVQSEMKCALQRFDTASSSSGCLETDVSAWSTKITLIYQQMLVLFRKSKELTRQLLLIFDKQRRSVFREAFWVNERPIEEISLRSPISVFEIYKSITKVEYLKKLPRCTIFCEETDCPGEYCPIIFEEKYSRHPNLQLDLGENPLPNSLSMPAMKSTDKHKSFRERLRKETRKLIHPRRKSLDCSQSLSRKVKGATNRNRTKTLADMHPDSGGGLVDSIENSLAKIENKFSKIEDEALAPSSCHSAPTASPSHDSDFGRCSAAGESDTLIVENAPLMVSEQNVNSNEIASALRTSVSADDVLALPSSENPTSSAVITGENVDKLTEENPKEIMAAFELLREREAAKRILRDDAHYEGILYSEKSGKSQHGPVFSPLNSEFVVGEPLRRGSASKTHLVVFVHGLEGSQDDLLPFRSGLDQAVSSFYHTSQTELAKTIDEPWNFEYLMSSANRSQTWADIKTMAHNLLAEVREYVEESRADIQRISFMAHSLGGVIVRSAIGMVAELELEWLAEKCHTLMTINSPHLGLAYVQKHIHWGVQFVKWWKKSRSMEQLTFRDSVNFVNSFVYQVAVNGSCEKFKHVLLVGTPHDQLVPYMSSLLVPSKSSSEDQSKFGEIYREMMSAILNSVRSSEKTENFVRYFTFHQLGSSNAQKLTGRAAHVAALEDEVFIEKLFNISAVNYFV
uniref:DUF676 domain-containing protein n=1 Tax=Caenorhabditis japonica TaxID=281687 RepID=A0A8R1HJQ4_CAEJA